MRETSYADDRRTFQEKPRSFESGAQRPQYSGRGEQSNTRKGTSGGQGQWQKGFRTQVRDILTRDPWVIRPDAPICEAAQMMREMDVGMLPVCDGQRLVGSITDRDIAVRAVARGCDPIGTQVCDVMSENVCYCFEDSDLEEAARVMEENQIRRLPVLNRNKRLVGIISLGDLALRSPDWELTEEVLECVSESRRF